MAFIVAGNTIRNTVPAGR